MKTLSRILNVLQFQPEWWAVYKLGQKKEEFSSEFSEKPRFTGVLLRIASFVFGVLKAINYNNKEGMREPADCVIFAHSLNQAASLAPTARRLEAGGLKLRYVISPSALGFFPSVEESKSESIALGICDALKVVLLALIRAPIIWNHLGGSDKMFRIG